MGRGEILLIRLFCKKLFKGSSCGKLMSNIHSSPPESSTFESYKRDVFYHLLLPVFVISCNRSNGSNQINVWHDF